MSEPSHPNTTHDPRVHEDHSHEHDPQEHDHQEHRHHVSMGGQRSTALSATLHCLTGCAIGEIAGLMIGTAIGLSAGWTVVLAVGLAFLFGYALSTLPLVKAGLGVGAAVAIVFAADTLSIATMEVVDNAVMALIPGAMDEGLVNPGFWISMMIALTAAFAAAYPVNKHLLERGNGHALTHVYHHAHADPVGARRFIPSLATSTLVAAIAAFLIGGLVVSLAVELGEGGDGDRTERGGHAASLSVER